jgi:hypothetical protein
MPISTIADRQASSYDALAVIRPITAAAISATTSETGLALPLPTFEDIALVLQVRPISSFVAGTATWTITLEVSANLGSGYVSVRNLTIPAAAADQYFLPVSGATFNKVVPGAAFARVTATKVGTPGNLTYAAYFSPAECC